MRSTIKSIKIAVLSMFAVPIGALLVALNKKTTLDDLFIASVGKNDARTMAELRSKGLSFESFCAADIKNQYADVCSLIDQVHLFQWAAIATCVLGLIAIALAIIVPWLAGGSRKWLALTFSPTVRMVTFAVGVSFCMQAVLAAYGLYTAEVQTVGQFHPQIIGAIAIGGLFAGGLVLKSTFSIFQHRPMFVIGKMLDPAEEPEFFTKLAGLANRLGAAMPENVVVGMEPNFYVTSAPIILAGQEKALHGNTLYVSLPLCRLMTRSELDAVIGHEFGHFSGEDTAYSLKFAPAYRTLSEALMAVSRQARMGGLTSALAIPAASMLDFCLTQFARVERRIGRERELLADRAGASIGGALPLATALLKAGLYTPIWPMIVGKSIENLNAGRSYRNLSELFGQVSDPYGREGVEKKIREFAGQALVHPTDTHPSTRDRISALKLDVAEISTLRLVPPDQDQASLQFRSLTTIEETLTVTYLRWLLATHQAVLPESEQTLPS